MNDYEIQKIRDTAFCSGYNTAVSKYEKQNKELQKENAELKEKLGNYQKGMFDEIEKRDINLTKAKEIIKELLDFDFLPDIEIKKQAEQFLKDQEE